MYSIVKSKVRYKFICEVLACVIVFAITGCGQEASDGDNLNTATIVGVDGASEKNDSAESTGTDATEAKDSEKPQTKKEQYEALMRENSALWNEYNAVLQEIAYYDVLRQDEIASWKEFKPASEKLNETREDNPLRLRPPVDFSALNDTEEEVIPEIADEELDAWIEKLQSQNELITEQTKLLGVTRNALKERYGVSTE